MARPRTPLPDRILARSHREGDHLIWDGHMQKGHPYLARVGNPARILLGLTEHPDYQIRRDKSLCEVPNCIDPHHFNVIREVKFKYDDEPNTPWRDPRIISQFTDRELQEIEDEVQALIQGESKEEDLDIFPDHIKAEILKRASASATA